MIGFGIFLGGITLYVVGSLLEWFADRIHGRRRK